MLDEPTGRRIRSVIAQLEAGERLPVGELVQLSASAAFDVTIDRRGHPAIVLVRPRRAAVFAGLSRRELEVAALVAAGCRNREIADRLYISLATVKDHVHVVLTKTGLASRAAVVAAWHGARDA